MRSSYSAARGSLLRVMGVGLLLLAAGCGGSRGTVSGKVLYKGKPLPGGSVLFIHQQGSFSSGIGGDGSYLIERVPAGAVKIAVLGTSDSTGTSMPKDVDPAKLKQTGPELQDKGPKELMAEMTRPAEQSQKAAVFVPPKYGNPEQSGLTYTVVGGAQTYDIKLE